MRRARRELTRSIASSARPPAPPAGWRAAPPDFVGVGVQRGGTSWWFREIERHAPLHRLPGAPKELHFFDRRSCGPLEPEQVAEYHAWFARPDGPGAPGANGARRGLTGEWTPSYMYDPWCLPLLALAAPSTRVLVMLRDPVDRFGSALAFQLRRGVSHSAAVVDAYHRGLYSEQMARVLSCFDRSRGFVLLYEDAHAEMPRELARTLEFLGADPTRPVDTTQVSRPRRRTNLERELAPLLLDELRARYRDDLDALVRIVPDVDFGRWHATLGA